MNEIASLFCTETSIDRVDACGPGYVRKKFLKAAHVRSNVLEMESEVLILLSGFTV